MSETPKIYAAMAKIMLEVEPVAKDKQGHGYKFRGIDDVYAALQMIMARNGVFCVPEVLSERSEERTSAKGATLIYRVLKIKYHFYAEDGSTVSAIVIGEGMDSGDKASNKAMSVAQKYALIQAFCIPTSEPKDPEIDHHEVKAAQPAARLNYEAKPEQKNQLMRWMTEAGVTNVDKMKALNERMIGLYFDKEVFKALLISMADFGLEGST